MQNFIDSQQPEDEKILQQGQQAVFNGRAFEQDVTDRLIRRSYENLKVLPDQPTKQFFIQQWRSPYRSAYGNPMTIDFYIWHPFKYPEGLLLECKYQDKPGSADHKLYYTVDNLKNTCLPSMLALMGSGASQGARAWCEKQADEKLIVITSFDDWNARCNRGLF